MVCNLHCIYFEVLVLWKINFNEENVSISKLNINSKPWQFCCFVVTMSIWHLLPLEALDSSSFEHQLCSSLRTFSFCCRTWQIDLHIDTHAPQLLDSILSWQLLYRYSCSFPSFGWRPFEIAYSQCDDLICPLFHTRYPQVEDQKLMMGWTLACLEHL